MTRGGALAFAVVVVVAAFALGWVVRGPGAPARVDHVYRDETMRLYQLLDAQSAALHLACGRFTPPFATANTSNAHVDAVADVSRERKKYPEWSATCQRALTEMYRSRAK